MEMPDTEGKTTGACPTIILNTKPTKIAWGVAS
jgi:hypothetical protein